MPASASVFLNVHDIDKSLDFYRSLGFRVTGAWKDDAGKTAWAELTLQGADLGLGHIASNDEKEFRDWVSTPLGAGVIVYFSLGNVDRIWERIRGKGYTVEMPLTDRPYGRMFTLNDPDGYVVSFIREPTTRKRPAAKKAGVKKAGAKKAAARKAPKKAAAKKSARTGAKKSAKRATKKTRR